MSCTFTARSAPGMRVLPLCALWILYIFLSSFHSTHCHFLQLELFLKARLTDCLGRRVGCDAKQPLVHFRAIVPDWVQPHLLALLRTPVLPGFQSCPVQSPDLGMVEHTPAVPESHILDDPHQMQMASPSSVATELTGRSHTEVFLGQGWSVLSMAEGCSLSLSFSVSPPPHLSQVHIDCPVKSRCQWSPQGHLGSSPALSGCTLLACCAQRSSVSWGVCVSACISGVQPAQHLMCVLSSGTRPEAFSMC